MRIYQLLAAMALFCMALPVSADESPIPDRRAIVYESSDLYGGDIRTILDTTLDICENACLDTASCTALTFNQIKGACFLKNSTGERSFFDGAISFEIVNTPPALMARGVLRQEDLGFLPDGYLTRATRRAAQIGRKYPVNDAGASELGLRFEGAMAANAYESALTYSAQLLSYEDSGTNWLNVATLAGKLAQNDSTNRRSWQSLARDAALNAYLRSGKDSERATAMVLMAQLLESGGEGRRSIDALRLANRLDPQKSTEAALDRAIDLFGFKIVDTQVDNNAARPRICVNFNEDLIELGVDYADFASTDLPVEASGSQLCFDGVSHGKSYEITLRAGLPAASGEVLQKSASISTYVRDRDPLVHFIGRAYVLPMTENPSIPVVTVNAQEVELRLSRIGARNLVPTMLYGILNENLVQYSEDDIANERGEEVWRGIGEVDNTLNQDVITALPLAPAIKDFEPGIYAMTARIAGSTERWDEAATQWFIVTDLGVETLLGNDGLHVFARSLRSAGALAGVTARLIATNNKVLFETTTDATGYAHIPAGYTTGEGGNSPAMVQLASATGDFAFVDLNDAAMDLSDRGVAGRAAPGKIDIFASTERGAYRPRETVYATVLARNARVDATKGLPLTAVLYRPDGVEAARAVLPDAGAGGRVFAHTLSASAMRGTWRLDILANPEEASLKSLRFLVEDFVPERIDFTLEMPEAPLQATSQPRLNIAAKYLYGAPASGLFIEGEVEVSAIRSLEAYPGVSFGLVDEPFINGYEGISSEKPTDENGDLTLRLALPAMEPSTRPMQMRATLRMADGSGRPVERSITREILPDGPRIGIKPLFEGPLREGSEAAFDIIAINSQGSRTAMEGVTWELSKIERHYQWYRYNGRWNWEPITRRIRVATGDINLTADEAARISALIDWGHYELKLVNAHGPYTASSYTFNSGWWNADASTDTPDVLDVSLNKGRYTVGDTARLRIDARAAGKVLVRVVSDRLISMQAVDVAAGVSMIDVPVAEDWGAGAYIIATLIQPMDEVAGRNPARAIGLAYAPTDPGQHQLAASFDMPAEIRPRGPLNVRLKVEGAGDGPVYATLAAVDVGILNLTGFESPDPSGYYFGQRRLGMEMRDIYGRLINGLQGTPGLLRSGGDGALSRVNAPPPTQKLIAYFSGPVKVGPDGYATTSFDLPAFNGTVRLMAVVWSDRAVGNAEYDLLVRDPVVVTTAMPRFLAPNDETRLRVDIANVKGPAGAYTVAVSGTGAVQSDSPEAGLDIDPGGQATLEFPIHAMAAGSGQLDVVLTAPDGRQFRQVLDVSVRANDPLLIRSLTAPLASNGSFSIDTNVFADFQPGSGTGSFALGPLARFDVAGMLNALDRTPWGNTETRISRAMPLLYLADIAAEMDMDGNFDVQKRVTTAIDEVLANQAANGAFGQWAPRSGDLWLDAFASEFLSRARAAGYTVPERAFTQAINNLRNQLNYAGDFENGGEDVAYALYVLAREGQASIGDLRYYADVKADDFATPLALAQLGSALALMGDQPRADLMFALAYDKVAASVEDLRAFRKDYGSQRRDIAALLALAVEAGSAAVNTEALAARLETPERYYSSQERLWQLMAAKALIENTSGFSVDGLPVSGAPVVFFDAETLATGPMLVQNNGAKAMGRMTTIGAPLYDEPPMQNGYRIERWLYTFEGEPATEIIQNQRYVAILRVTPEQERRGRLIISDPLPAGFEIDNPNLLRSGDISKLDWLQLDNSGISEFREDRFLNAITWDSKKPVQMAYIVRAVSPGVFRQPAALVEDMYRPALRATTGADTVTIQAAP